MKATVSATCCCLVLVAAAASAETDTCGDVLRLSIASENYHYRNVQKWNFQTRTELEKLTHDQCMSSTDEGGIQILVPLPSGGLIPVGASGQSTKDQCDFFRREYQLNTTDRSKSDDLLMEFAKWTPQGNLQQVVTAWSDCNRGKQLTSDSFLKLNVEEKDSDTYRVLLTWTRPSLPGWSGNPPTVGKGGLRLTPDNMTCSGAIVPSAKLGTDSLVSTCTRKAKAAGATRITISTTWGEAVAFASSGEPDHSACYASSAAADQSKVTFPPFSLVSVTSHVDETNDPGELRVWISYPDGVTSSGLEKNERNDAAKETTGLLFLGGSGSASAGFTMPASGGELTFVNVQRDRGGKRSLRRIPIQSGEAWTRQFQFHAWNAENTNYDGSAYIQIDSRCP